MLKKIQIENISLAYLEVNEHQTDTIFFVHFNSSSHRTWTNQLASADLANYRLIAFDLPAHGESSASPTPDKHYGVADLGHIIGKAITILADKQNYIVIGSSLGTNIICEALPYINPDGIVLTATSIVGEEYPYCTIFNPNADTSVLSSETADEEKLKTFFSNCVYKINEVIAEQLEDYKKVKSPFRSVMFQQSMTGGRLSDEIDLLRNCDLPLLIIFGKEEKIINPDYLDAAGLNIWRNTFFKIPEAGHLLHLDQPDVFTDLVATYAIEQFREYHV